MIHFWQIGRREKAAEQTLAHFPESVRPALV
jgi:hypothetical protein